MWTLSRRVDEKERFGTYRRHWSGRDDVTVWDFLSLFCLSDNERKGSFWMTVMDDRGQTSNERRSAE